MTMEGWLVKKNQTRYFILKGKILYWFGAKQSADADLCALARGSLNLEKCSLDPPDRPLTFKIKAPLGVYVLKCKSAEEVEQWSKALQAAMAIEATVYDKTGSLYVSTYNQKMFSVLKGTQLQWFENEQDGTAKDAIDLKGCVIGPVSDSASLVISVPYLNNKQIRVTSYDGLTDITAWHDSLQNAINLAKTELDQSKLNSIDNEKDVEREGYLEKKGKRRYFKLFNHSLTWYDQDPKNKNIEINGSLFLKGCQVANVGFTITIKPYVGTSYTLKASSQQEANDWVEAFNCASNKTLSSETQKVSAYDIKKREGWVIKKGVGKVVGQTRRQLRRYIKIDIHSSTLKYYDSDLASSPKGVIHLAGCKASSLDEKTFMVLTGHGRDYPFECADREEVSEWVKSITYYINRADEDMKKAVIKHQWLIGGKSYGDRWVVINKEQFMLWFTQVVPPQEINTERSTGWVKISSCRFEKHREIKFSFWVISDRAPPITFTCPDSTSFESWFPYLKSISEGGDGKVNVKRLVFKRDLGELLQSEGTNIPNLVVKCAQFIRQYGTDVQGIFRLSGQADEIQKYTTAFDEGQDVVFPVEADVNAVAGVLKSFFRVMPEPAIPCALYPLFLQIDGVESAKNAIASLPKPNNDLLNYLCHFLSEMAQYVQVTSMNFENISIVFAPNLLRTNDSNSMSSLTDTPKVLKAIQFIIENYSIIWEEGPPEVIKTAIPSLPSNEIDSIRIPKIVDPLSRHHLVSSSPQLHSRRPDPPLFTLAFVPPPTDYPPISPSIQTARDTTTSYQISSPPTDQPPPLPSSSSTQSLQATEKQKKLKRGSTQFRKPSNKETDPLPNVNLLAYNPKGQGRFQTLKANASKRLSMQLSRGPIPFTDEDQKRTPNTKNT